MSRMRANVLVVMFVAMLCHNAAAQTLVAWDFTSGGEHGWIGRQHIEKLVTAPQGLRLNITGSDPFIHGPRFDVPEGQLLWLRVKINSDQSGMAQVFYFREHAREQDSLRFAVRADRWEELSIPLPSLGRGYHLRFDPPGVGGSALIESIRLDARTSLVEPAWPKPVLAALGKNAAEVKAGRLVLRHAVDRLGAFELSVDGRSMLRGHDNLLIAYVHDGRQRAAHLSKAMVNASFNENVLTVNAALKDDDGAVWEMHQTFAPMQTGDGIALTCRWNVDKPRQVTFLPMLVGLAGAGEGSFGSTKTQAVLPGLEYLDKDEPSSSEADIIGTGSQRRTPDALKITFPLMAVAADGRYVGLVWEQQVQLTALFDSPDRTFNSAGHAMGLIFPGSNGTDRAEGHMLPYAPRALPAGEVVEARATFIGGPGQSIVPAVQQYVVMRGLPQIPKTGVPNLDGYIKLAAAGWLDSQCADQANPGLYRHAYPGTFKAHPAGDAALMMRWLGERSADQTLAQRLAAASNTALSMLKPGQHDSAAVGHIRTRAQSLMFGGVTASATSARNHGHALLRRFEKDGFIRYAGARSSSIPGSKDLGSTHFAPDANGLTAQVLQVLFDCAAISGDAELREVALRHLRALSRYDNTVPRGAQTWEVPLHTPDIMASAHLVQVYLAGYQMTGDAQFLEKARYWAWTGVPFVYLIAPTDEPIGPYATIAVFGATHYIAPNWMGMPVQWCGLVYADALYELAEVDSSGPWKKLADGITASGIQQTIPLDADPQRKGLLPDSYTPRAGLRNDPCINPATLQACAARFYGQGPIYDRKPLERQQFVHAPGMISDLKAKSFTVTPWSTGAYYVLVTGCPKLPEIKVDDAAIPADAVEYSPEQGILVLRLQGRRTITLK